MGQAKQRGTFEERKTMAQIKKQVNVKIDPADLKACKCKAEGCDSELFTKAVRIKMASSVHPKNPTGKDIYADFEVSVCLECHAVFEE